MGRVIAGLVCLLLSVGVGCSTGADANLVRAQRTTAVTWQLITETEQALDNGRSLQGSAGGEIGASEGDGAAETPEAAGGLGESSEEAQEWSESQEVRVARDWVSRGVPDRTGQIGAALTELQDRFRESQHAMRIWTERGVGRLAWETLAPCVLDGIVGLRRAFHDNGIEVPSLLEEAETMTRGFSEGSCVQRRRARDQRQRAAEQQASP